MTNQPCPAIHVTESHHTKTIHICINTNAYNPILPIQMYTISLSLSFNFLPEHVGIHCISLSFLFLALTRSQTPLDVKIIIYILAMFSAKLTKCLVYILVCFIFLVLFVDMSLTLFHEGVLHFK